MRRYARLAPTVAALVAAGLLTACSADPAPSTTEPPASSAATPAGAAGDEGKKADATADAKIAKSGVEDHEVWGPGAYVVHYKITNSGTEAANYFVGLEFLDKDGDVLGSTGVAADKLGPGKSHTGDTAPLESEIRNGKMTDIASVRVSGVDRSSDIQ